MKKFIYSLAIAAAFMTSSCINDLDTLPLNETDKTAETSYQTLSGLEEGLAYVYGSFCLVSQNAPGSSDLAMDDAGQSELMRQYVMLNEMSVDALKCIWGDSYIVDLQNNSWSSTPNSSTIAVYTRGMMAITRANEFLIQSKDKDFQGVAQLRAEARFLRALAYYFMMDLFGNPPFALEENINGELPGQIGRANLFNWIENELKSIINGTDGEQLADKGAVDYPRADKGAATALLARMYLNAEVYTGTARWQDARDAAKAVIDMGYRLCSNYEDLFLQDNGENEDARNEMIYAVAYDRDNTQSWGGTTHFVSATLSDAAAVDIAANLGFPAGSLIARERWNGYHVPSIYVERNFELTGVDWNAKSGFGYDREHSDKRAMLYNIGGTEAYDKADVNTGWRCWKWTSRDSKGNLYSSGEYSLFSSADFAIFRLAEMYLIYAEAQARMDGGTTTDATAINYVKALRDRAGLETPSYIDLDFILKERGAELMWEGHRRTDLIRYGYFNSSKFPWPYKGGVPDGKTSLPSFRTIYPLLQSDLNENPNLVQNEGY
ncbi:MAG: RagB/SusD family nutrient uptake outer membrane protein [Phocaeicola sp.]|nr:RagB/SusD family nutrient uptake outer membrane protein [Phocaeicola sp.]